MRLMIMVSSKVDTMLSIQSWHPEHFLIAFVEDKNLGHLSSLLFPFLPLFFSSIIGHHPALRYFIMGEIDS